MRLGNKLYFELKYLALNILKKIISILLAIPILISITGFSVVTHYCGGQSVLTEINLKKYSMNKLIQNTALGLSLFMGLNLVQAQCPTGEVELELTIETDQYASEGYWEIVPSGNSCGVGTIASGGNNLVGCNGGGAQAQPSGGYANNQSIASGPHCIIQGASYDLIYIDDWGDGGFEFEVEINGYQTESFNPMAGGNFTLTFIASEPEAYDIGLYNVTSPQVYDEEGPKVIEGTIFNYGTILINSVDISYQVDNGTINTFSFTGLNLDNYEAYTFSHPTQWNAIAGNHIIKTWISNLDGNADLNNLNDTLTKAVELGIGIPNIIDDYLSYTPYIATIGDASDQLVKPTDLDFHPLLSKKELWVVNERTEDEGGSTVIYNNAGESNQSDQFKADENAWHFMSLPKGIAYSKNGNFATASGVFDANHDGGDPFTGPALWSGDLSIYAEPSGGNGSHLDMLHTSPYCQGVASEKDNVFWVYDGYNNDIVRYDFVDDHGPGNSFHGDAIIHRYNDFSVVKDPNNKVVSHLVISDGWVYVVDYGNQKVFRIQMNTGTLGSTPSFGPFESVVEYKYMTNYNWENVVTTGLLEPTGIDVIDDRMIVSDYATGEIIIYDISIIPATELGRVNTGAEGIMGIKIGPEGKIWYVDYDSNSIHKMTDIDVGIEEYSLEDAVTIYPNPVINNVNIVLKEFLVSDVNIEITDITGKIIYKSSIDGLSNKVNTESWISGIYIIHISNQYQAYTEKLIVKH